MTDGQTFFFVRHGETEPNARGVRCGGDVDAPLTENGVRQAEALCSTLRGRGVGVIVASPLQRTRRTAEIVAQALDGIPIVFEPLFAERRLGEWNGRTIAETEPLIRARETPPGGESEAEFRDRVARALEALRPHLPRRPLVVSSRGVARMLNLLCGGSTGAPAANAELIEYRAPGPDPARRTRSRVPARKREGEAL